MKRQRIARDLSFFNPNPVGNRREDCKKDQPAKPLQKSISSLDRDFKNVVHSRCVADLHFRVGFLQDFSNRSMTFLAIGAPVRCSMGFFPETFLDSELVPRAG